MASDHQKNPTCKFRSKFLVIYKPTGQQNILTNSCQCRSGRGRNVELTNSVGFKIDLRKPQKSKKPIIF